MRSFVGESIWSIKSFFILSVLSITIGIQAVEAEWDVDSDSEVASSIADESDSSELELEAIQGPMIQRVLPGKRSADALRNVLQLQSLSSIFKRFHPTQTELDWQVQSIEALPQSHVVHASFRKIEQKPQVEKPAASGFLGYFNQAVSAVQGFATTWLTGELIGELTSVPIQCQGEKSLPGYLLNFSLAQSSYLISSQAQAVQVEVCWEAVPDQMMTRASFSLRIIPGFYSSITATPETLSLIQTQLESWVNLLSDSVGEEEAKLIQKDFSP